MNAFGWASVVTLLIICGIGIAANRLIKGRIESFMVMDRQATAPFICGTFIASWLSMSTFVGMMALAYVWGATSVMWLYSSIWGITLFLFFVALPLRRGGFVTVPDFLGDTFNSNSIRTLAAIILILGQTGYAILQIIAAGTTFELLLGWPYAIGASLFAVIVGVYVAVGGQWAVVLTDTLMLVVFVIAGFVAFPYTIKYLGGWKALTHVLPTIRPGVWNWDGIPKLPLAYLIGGFFTYVALTCSSPYLVTRAFIAKDERELSRGLTIGQALVTPFLWMLMIVAAGINLKVGKFANADYICGWWASNALPPWVGAFVFCGIVASGVSTLNTLYIVVGSGVARDIYQRVINPNVSERTTLKLTRASIIGMMIVGVIIALQRPSMVIYVSLWSAGVFAVTFLPAFLLALYYKAVTAKGVFWGMLAGLITYLPLTLVEKQLGAAAFAKNYGLSAVLWAALGCLVITIAVSSFTRRSGAEAEAYTTYMQKMFPFGKLPRLLDKPTPTDTWVSLVSFAFVLLFTVYLSYQLIAS